MGGKSNSDPDSRKLRRAIAGTAAFLGVLLLIGGCGNGNDAPGGAPATTPVVPAEELLARDVERLRELGLLQGALAEYRERFGSYPNNGGGIQTLCAYERLDKGCDLKEVLDDGEEGILADPVPGPNNGYWYASDGQTYTIWMLHEGADNPGDPICPEVIPHLKDKGPLFCITVGASPSPAA